jgi:hypothetical protein
LVSSSHQYHKHNRILNIFLLYTCFKLFLFSRYQCLSQFIKFKELWTNAGSSEAMGVHLLLNSKSSSNSCIKPYLGEITFSSIAATSKLAHKFYPNNSLKLFRISHSFRQQFITILCSIPFTSMPIAINR